MPHSYLQGLWPFKDAGPDGTVVSGSDAACFKLRGQVTIKRPESECRDCREHSPLGHSQVQGWA